MSYAQKKLCSDRNARGQCALCQKPLAPGHSSLCIPHRDKHNRSVLKRYRRTHVAARRQNKCRRCGRRGHMAKTCGR